MASYTPSDMDYTYDRPTRFPAPMRRGYDAMRGDERMGGDYYAAGDRRGGEVPRFFEEWDGRRAGRSYPRRRYEGSRPRYEDDYYYPRGEYRGDYRRPDYYPSEGYRGEGDYYSRGESYYRGEGYYPRGESYYPRGESYSPRSEFRGDYRPEFYARGDYYYPRGDYRMSEDYYPRGRGMDAPRGESRGDYYRRFAPRPMDRPAMRPMGEYMSEETGYYAGSPVEAGRGYELREIDGEYVCICELPGFERGDIECSYEDGVFYVDASREGSRDAENVWMRRSRRVSERIPVPRPVDVDGFSASYRNGILEVRMPIAGRDGRSAQVISIRD
ncbi:Hsp20/alpha crystallin family protein [Haloarchaeobius amylolyticus]|uniref:Hsp20/alpha crystallin family protein n=1 Tax=Haloarchaeobius amylolyticus TaxID=1198296 RepID=UPI00226E0446|nr:Hsp20/alpha crystallin family protein [Haloarchaeobius amylolyticus]